jgi:hypothetical protein
MFAVVTMVSTCEDQDVRRVSTIKASSVRRGRAHKTDPIDRQSIHGVVYPHIVTKANITLDGKLSLPERSMRMVCVSHNGPAEPARPVVP